MISFAKLGLLLAAAQSVTPDLPYGPIEFVKPEVAVSRVAACGFTSVSQRFDEVLQEEVIDVTGIVSATKEQLRCTALASLATHYYVIFPAAVAGAYDPLYYELGREQGLALARAWLDQRGLLSKVPVYDPQKSDGIEYGRSLEAICGADGANLFEQKDNNITLSVEALSKWQDGSDKFLCIINAATVSGYPLGFVGNEAYQSFEEGR